MNVNENISKAVTKSWKNKDVAARRLTRHAVKVKAKKKGTNRFVNHDQFRSVREAFRELGLPDWKHRAFRLELKEKGTAIYEDYKFELIELANV